MEGSPDCEGIALEVPAASETEDGCRRAVTFSVQLRQATNSEWEMVPESTGDVGRGSWSVIVRPLDPLIVYRFRTLAEAGPGLHSVSEETPPRMVGSFFNLLKEPPAILATSSASYSIKWKAALSPCQAESGFRWDLMYSRASDADSFHLGMPPPPSPPLSSLPPPTPTPTLPPPLPPRRYIPPPPLPSPPPPLPPPSHKSAHSRNHYSTHVHRV